MAHTLQTPRLVPGTELDMAWAGPAPFLDPFARQRRSKAVRA